jgi:phosphonate transport system substrate-binding protein
MQANASRHLSICVVALALFTAGCARPPAPAPMTLRVTAIPDANKDTLREDQARLVAWLSGRVGVPVEFLPVENYAAAVTALVSGQADLGWLGGVTTVQAMTQSGGRVQPLVTRESDLHFKSFFIAQAGKGAGLADLKGKSFTFGSKSSTSGHVMPRYFLEKEGIVPERDFARVAYSGDHTKTVLDVASGVVDAGVVNYKHFERMVAEKKADPNAVKVVWTTPDFVDYAWVVRQDVDERCGAGTRHRIAEAFTTLDPARENDKAILAVQQTERYVPARAEMWDGIKQVLERTDITK